MPFQIIRNDITLVEADAIVNTANPEPLVGAGTDCAIHRAAGPELLRARQRVGRIAVGETAATPAYGLKARYVLHSVGPAWQGGGRHEEELLRRAYDSALALADRLGCRSVAFPLMAAGSYGFPRDLALATAIRAFTDFLLDHDMQIELVLYNGEAFALAGSIFDDLKSYIDDNYVRQQERERFSARPGSRRVDYRRRAKRPAPPEDMDLDDSAIFGADAGFPADVFASPAAPAAAFAGSLDDILRQRESSFSEFLLDLLRERGGKDSEVYKRAEVSKQLFSKILNNPDYQPTKSTAVQLAIGLQLDLAQTQKLLGKAGYALTRSSKADLVVQYYIERKIYSIPFINAALYDCGLPLLKTGLKT